MKGASRGTAAFTIGEILVASSMLGLMASIMFAILNISMNLSARNVAINLAHHEARIGMDRVVHDLHQAVSIPQLVDGNLAAVNNTGPTAGISFQIITSGPFQVSLSDTGTDNQMQITTTSPKIVAPRIGDHMLILDYPIESDVTNVVPIGTAGNRWYIYLANGNDKKVQVKDGSFVVCYLTRRIAYVVAGTDLRAYPNLTATPTTWSVVARNVTSSAPFSIPLNDTGTPDTRYTNVNLVVTDPTYSRRSFAGAKTEIANAHVPYRYQLAQYQ